MTETTLLAAFEKIHPSHRELQFHRPQGKVHWVYLKTVPPEGSTDLSIPLVHLELSRGSAHQLAEFFLAAMEFARDRADLVKAIPAGAEPVVLSLRLERRAAFLEGELQGAFHNEKHRLDFVQQLEDVGFRVAIVDQEQKP